MAEAIISALSKSENQDMADIVVFDVNESRVEHLTATYGTKTCNNITEGMGEADVTLISVKPQNVESIGNLIQIPPKGLILSIVAGCTVDKLREVFKTDNIVRSMPNTPAMVMEAMTVWIATKQTPAEQVGNIPLTISKAAISIHFSNITVLPFFNCRTSSVPPISYWRAN
jgi:pyrroline-5-carboxylate reductase